MTDRPPPHDARAERAVLGSAMRDNSAIADVCQIVRTEHFYADAHRRLWATITDLFDGGQAVDLVTLAAEVANRGILDDCGGYAYLAELWDASPTAANAEYYAKIVRHHALLRALGHTARSIAEDAWQPQDDADQLLAQAEQQIFSLGDLGVQGQTVSLRAACSEAIEWMDQRSRLAEEDRQGVLTGFPELDGITAGWHASELILVAARPSTGKTALALAFALNAARSGYPTLVVSLEQSRKELACRLLQNLAEVDGQSMRRGTLTPAEVARIGQAEADVAQLPLGIDDSPQQNMLRIAANARRLKRRKDLRLIVVDYLQLIECEGRGQNRQEQVSQLSRRLKLLARELEIPVIVLCQLNRDVESRAQQRPRLADLRESGSLEQDADVVLMLWRPEGKGSPEIEICVEKQRNGPLGDCKLVFFPKFMRFENFVPAYS